MSLNAVIQRFRDAALSLDQPAPGPSGVTSLQTAESRTYQENPLTINRVTPDTGVTSIQDEIQGGSEPGLSEPTAGDGPDPRGKSENGELLDSGFSRNGCSSYPPLTEHELVALITRTAKRFKLCPADLWAFLSLEDLDALRSGDPQELQALGAFAESVSRTGERIMGGHNLPFPGEAETPGTHHGPVCCGNCGRFERDAIGDGHGIGRCLAGVPPRPGFPARYPRAERYCRGFVAKDG